MPCITIANGETGAERHLIVDEGVSFSMAPAEVIKGIANECGGYEIAPLPHDRIKPLMAELDDEIGTGAGDWIRTLVKPLAKLVGKSGCSRCEARRIATNAYSKLKVQYGQVEALRIMKELWERSFEKKADSDEFVYTSDELLEQLKAYLK